MITNGCTFYCLQLPLWHTSYMSKAGDFTKPKATIKPGDSTINHYLLDRYGVSKKARGIGAGIFRYMSHCAHIQHEVLKNGIVLHFYQTSWGSPVWKSAKRADELLFRAYGYEYLLLKQLGLIQLSQDVTAEVLDQTTFLENREFRNHWSILFAYDGESNEQ